MRVRWGHVQEEKSSRMDRIKKSGIVQDCVNELVRELGGGCTGMCSMPSGSENNYRC